jgi:hypothetical protein
MVQAMGVGRRSRLKAVAVTGVLLILIGIGLLVVRLTTPTWVPTVGCGQPCGPTGYPINGLSTLIEALTGLVSALAGLISSVVALLALRHARPKAAQQPVQANEETQRPRLWTPHDGAGTDEAARRP